MNNAKMILNILLVIKKEGKLPQLDKMIAIKKQQQEGKHAAERLRGQK